MATFPYFVLSPNAILSIIGLIHGPDETIPTAPEDWREATVDVVIPALNEESNIALCLASLARQTMKPKRITLIDDGSSDQTIRIARDLKLEVFVHDRNYGYGANQKTLSLIHI